MRLPLLFVVLAANISAAPEDADVVITLKHPRDGAEVACPFAPQLELAVGGSGPLVDRIKYAPSEWAICTEVDGRGAACQPLVGAAPVGVALAGAGLSPRHAHVLKVYLRSTAGDGARAGTATARFTVAAPRVPPCDFFLGRTAGAGAASAASAAAFSEGQGEAAAYRNGTLDDAAATAAALKLSGACGAHLAALAAPHALCDADDADGDDADGADGAAAATPARVAPAPALARALVLPRGAWGDPRAAAANHQALLAHLVRGTGGPVLELGVNTGAVSTPLLRALVDAANGDGAPPRGNASSSDSSSSSSSSTGDIGSGSESGSPNHPHPRFKRRRMLVTVDDDAEALRAAMRRLPPSRHHRYALVAARSAADRHTGAHWARFFAPSGDPIRGSGSGEDDLDAAASWAALAARWGGGPVSVAVVALPSRRGRVRAVAKLAHRAAYLLLPDALPPPPSYEGAASRGGDTPGAAAEDDDSDVAASSFWDLWLQVGVYDDPGRCLGGPSTVVLTNRPGCRLPAGPEAWPQPKYEHHECSASLPGAPPGE